jgi:endonuclease G, mitochondrial
MKYLTLSLISVIISTVVWAGDVSDSKVKDYGQFFDKDSCDQILTDTFTICYSHKRKSAKAVYVKIYGDKVVKDMSKRPGFWTDKRLSKIYQTTSSDYTNTGYDRGHFGASDASHDHDAKNQKATYSMANIVPQTPRANRYKFVALERHERAMAVKHGMLENVTLAFWNAKPKTIGKSKLQVPSAFAKIYTGHGHGHGGKYRECFFVWNTDIYDMKIGADPNTYKVDCKKVVAMWETNVGTADSWAPEDSKELKRLLKKLSSQVPTTAKHIKMVFKMVP